MNILSIIPKLNNLQDCKDNYSKSGCFVGKRYPNLTPLVADTVSFSGRNVRAATNSIGDCLEAQFVRNATKLNTLAESYLNVLDGVATKLENFGFSFDRKYCELNPVKSSKSYISKILRSQVLKVPDKIRATLYCKNPYDLSALDMLLKEMDKKGFTVATTETPVKTLMKRGYVPTEEIDSISKYLASPSAKGKDVLKRLLKSKGYDTSEVTRLLDSFVQNKISTRAAVLEQFGRLNKKVPDLDIRLEDVKDKIFLLPEKYQYCVGSPQKSGYEDIQIRFVRKADLKNKQNKSPELHELIILFGENYSQAKHREAERVYSYLRGFGELNANKYFDNQKYNSITNSPKTYIGKIETLFRSEVSTKEFSNAKTFDYEGIHDEIPINFTKLDEEEFKSSFDKLTLGLQVMYEKLKYRANTKGKMAIQKREDADIQALAEIRNGLKETMKTYQKEAAEKEKALKPHKN